jgi:ribosomal protein L37AE/L43A
VNFSLQWLLNVIVSALLVGFGIRLFTYMAKRTLGVEVPRHQSFWMLMGLIFLLTLTGSMRDATRALPLVALVIGGAFVVRRATVWLSQDKLERLVDRLSPAPPPPADMPHENESARRKGTILLATERDGLKCPVCRREAMSRKTKLNLGPAKTHACDSCGASVGPSWAFSLIVCFPAIAGLATFFVLPLGAAIVAAFLALAIMFALMFRYWLRVPLMEKKV